MMKTVVMLQARIGSSRLPCKVLKHLGSKSIVELAMESLLEIPAEDYLLVIDEKSQMALSPLAHKYGFKVFIGPELDVLKRFGMASKAYPSDIIIRATADNPLVSSEAAIYARDILIKEGADYVGLVGMPLGTGVEVVKRDSLMLADKEATDPYDREHVCPYLYRHPDQFKILQPKAPEKWYYPKLSVTIDRIEDFLNVESFFKKIYQNRPLKIEEFVPYMPEPPKYLFYPSIKEGNGLGHLMRSLRLSLVLGQSAFYTEDPLLFAKLVEKTGFELPQFYIDFHQSDVDWIIVDQRECDELPDKLKSMDKSVLSLDEGGMLRSKADYLIDSLPNFLEEKSNAVVSPVFYSELENRSDEDSFAGCDLLVSFGGEDPQDLLAQFLENLPLTCMVEHKITVVLGPNYRGIFSSFTNRTHFGKIEWIIAPNSLLRFIKNSRIVLTSFGLTAYEAISLDKEVYLLEPSTYHHQLAKKGDFNSYLMNQIPSLIKKIQLRLESPTLSVDHRKAKEIITKSENISDHIQSLSLSTMKGCPVCGSKEGMSVLRLPYQTFFHCGSCGSLYQKRFDDAKTQYNEDYFFKDYEQQYGKTYLEDFEPIYQMGIQRCNSIEALYQEIIGKESTIPSCHLLDLGAAYGHFLQAAKDKGWIVAGVDISENAVSYLKEKGFSAIARPLQDCTAEELLALNQGRKWDIITLWYVIEHFKSLEFFWRLIPQILRPGGILAFSTPSFRGISGRKNLNDFLKASPKDHYMILSPASIRHELKKRGFTEVRIESTGHHPERFSAKLPKWLYKSFISLSRHFELGDTFQCYAVLGEKNEE